MGLKLTLKKENNSLCHDFIDAYWHIENLTYTTTQVGGVLKCYPSREASLKNGTQISSSLPIGNPVSPIVEAGIYRWDFVFRLSDVFDGSIPLDEDEQMTAIYVMIKQYTGLPFEDVFEE